MIGLREDQQMKVRMVNFLNHTAAECGRGLAPDCGVSLGTSISEPPLSEASPLPHSAAVSFRWTVGSAASKAVG